MRKFCWIYKHRNTGEVVFVQHPRRREVDPKYSVKRNRKIGTNLGYQIVENLSAVKFRMRYVYVGKLKENHDE